MNEKQAIDPGLPQAKDLRREAERRLQAGTAKDDPAAAEADARALVHELQVHQIELEMQNEELQRAQVEAREASEKYYDLFDFAPVGYFLWDHEGQILEVNLAGAALLGLIRHALIHKRFGQFVALDDRPAFAAFCQGVLTAGTLQSCEVKLLRDKQPVDVLVEGIAAPDRQGRGKVCRAAVIEITQQKRAEALVAANQVLQSEIVARKQAEQALGASKERYRTLAEATFEGVCISEQGLIRDCNEQLARMLGYRREELIAMPIADLLPAEFRERVLDNIRQGRDSVTEHEVLRKDGGRRIVEAHGRNLGGEESSLRITSMRDITHRKLAEESLRDSEARYRSLFEHMLDGFAYCKMLFDQHGHPQDFVYLDVNEAFGRLTGLDDVIGRTFTEVIPGIKELVPELFEFYGRVVSTGNPQRFEIALKPLDLWLAVSAYRTEKDCFVAVFDNITQRKQAEESLEKHARAAEAANVAKSQFLANMSHELRTPMNAILGMIDVALSKTVDATVQDCLQTAKGSADMLLTLLNDLLDTAKIESGKLELELAPFSLRRMLDHVTSVLSVRASERGLCFFGRMPEGTPDVVVGDRLKLQRVLLNLAGNAIKFTEYGEVEVSVCVSPLPPVACDRPVASDRMGEGTVALEFAVRDTGIGIPPAALEHLFEPFTQADASMTRRFGGTGLGLSICKGLVEMMGGQIRVESEVDKGSTFYFTICLPLAKELPADLEAPVAVPAAPCGPLRILLVEDNPANQKLATYILRDRGHAVQVASDGQEAIDLVARDGYDVILMDVQMPEMDGLKATAAIRQREAGGRRVPIIAMTAHSMESDRNRCLAAGMDGYLSKPIRAQELIEKVERLGGAGDGKLQIENCKSQVSDFISQTEPPILCPPSPIPSPFNLDEALARLGDDSGLFREMVDFFFCDATKLLMEIQAAATAGDATAIERKAHRLKGTVLYLGAEAATEAVAGVEALARSGDLTDAAPAIRSMEREVARLAEALHAYVESFVPTDPAS